MRCAQSDIIVTHSVTIIECRVESLECRCCPRICAGYHPGLATHATRRAGPGHVPPLRRGELCSAMGWSLCPTPSCFACPPPWNHPRKLCLRGARWAVGIICPLHSNKKRGGAPFFLNTVCVYPTTVSQQSWCHAFVAAQGVYDTACLGRVQIHNAYFVHVTFLDDDGVAIFHHTGRQ